MTIREEAETLINDMNKAFGNSSFREFKELAKIVEKLAGEFETAQETIKYLERTVKVPRSMYEE